MESTISSLSSLQLEPRQPLHHVDLTPEVLNGLFARFDGDWNNPERDEAHERGLRTHLFKTDVIDQLLRSVEDDRVLRLIGTITETHEERLVVCARGLAAALSRLASRPRAFSATPSWLWVLHNHVYYLTDAEISPQLIHGACDALTSPACHPWPKKNALQALMRVALRGTATLRPLLAPRADEVAAWCSTLLGDGRLDETHLNACYTVCSFAYSLDRPELARAASEWLRARTREVGEPSDLVRMISGRYERKTRRHLQRTGYLRPGETWHMYLGMLSHPSADLRFGGAVILTVVLEAVGHSAFDIAPFETPSSRLYLDEALDARVRTDAALTRQDVETLRCAATGALPHALVAEAALRLAKDPVAEVRHLGEVACSQLPRRVLREVVWCPSTHHLFHPGARALVRFMLLLSQRGDIPLPADLLVMHVLPCACFAVP